MPSKKLRLVLALIVSPISAFASPAPSTIVINLADRVGLSREVVGTTTREVTRLWKAAGVDVQWVLNPGGPRRDQADVSGACEQPVALWVFMMGDDQDESGRADSFAPRRLASILFRDGKPTALISAYPSEALRLMEGAHRSDKPLAEMPRILWDRFIGRVLGRAIAHELGHYLLASAEHAPTGLMRATHSIDSLLSPSDRDFRGPVLRPRTCSVRAEGPPESR
jgi:hypothetical protein